MIRQPHGSGERQPNAVGIVLRAVFAAVIFALILSFLGGCTSRPVRTAGSSEAGSITVIDLESKGVNAEQVIEVPHDTVYQTRKRYRGVTFERYLQDCRFSTNGTTPNTVVQFVCDDGYNPIASLATLLHDGAFIATSDLEAPPGKTWVPFLSGKALRDPGPFYLVWPGKTIAGEGHPWPYGMTALRIGNEKALLGPAMPKSAVVQRGFALFRANCITCHSINGVGGKVGVDLNVPLNVFEYWQADKLAVMVANPTAIRANAKMPPFEQIGQENIRAVLAYIEYMKEHKEAVAP